MRPYGWTEIREFNDRRGDPAGLHLPDVSLDNFFGEEAPVARVGPRSPDAFIGARRPERPKNPADIMKRSTGLEGL